jgi:hypothetical protein
MNGRLETLQEQSLSRVAGNRRSIPEQPLWKSRLRVAVFAFVFLPFSPIWFSYPIHLFFLFRFKFFHLTLRRPPRYLNSSRPGMPTPSFSPIFSPTQLEEIHVERSA